MEGRVVASCAVRREEYVGILLYGANDTSTKQKGFNVKGRPSEQKSNAYRGSLPQTRPCKAILDRQPVVFLCVVLKHASQH